MGKIAAVAWVVLAPVMMGICVMIVLFIPSLANDQMKLMLPAAGTGLVVAIPLAILVAKRIVKTQRI